MHKSLFTLMMLLLIAIPIAAQDTPDMPAGDDPRYHPWQVFIERDINGTGLDRLIFVDTVSGTETTVQTSGERYTTAGNAVIYYDPGIQRVMLAETDGTLRTHPFIQPNLETRRVDWLVSADQTLIAWTLTDVDVTGRLTTTTTIANLDGTEPRQVLIDGPRPDGIRALPLAFSADKSILYMDLHPDGLGALIPIDRYASLIALDLASGQATSLPGEDRFSCFCGAAVGPGVFLRLGVSLEQPGYDVRYYNLISNTGQTIPTIGLRNFPEAGDMLISPDGTRAVYTAMQVLNLGTPNQSTRTFFMLVDLDTFTQERMTGNPITTLIRPIAWTEDNSAVLFVSGDPDREGTWKINLNTRRLERVAEATFIGTLRPLAINQP